MKKLLNAIAYILTVIGGISLILGILGALFGFIDAEQVLDSTIIVGIVGLIFGIPLLILIRKFDP